MNPSLPFAIYDAFTDTAFGGSQAGVVSNARSLDRVMRQQIAKEMGAPATAFVDATSENSITVQFFSTITELPMCGHGTICLLTRMVETGVLKLLGHAVLDVDLILPGTSAKVEVVRVEHDRIRVMLDIQPPSFKQQDVDLGRLANVLGIRRADLSKRLPVETAFGDFVHLVVPMNDLNAMGRVTPDFEGIIKFCHQYEIETVALFSDQVVNPENNIHVRDFCPAVGVAESAAAGTTNAALTSYLIRHGLANQYQSRNESETFVVTAEQGLEIQRPSTIRSFVQIQNGDIVRLQVGGIATKILDGQLYVPISNGD